jgi:hypothetical protein
MAETKWDRTFDSRCPTPGAVFQVVLPSVLALLCGLWFASIAQLFRHSWDAYTHLFFADHYLRGWFRLYEERWFTGFSVASYPPLAHQTLAVAVRVAGSPERGLQLLLIAIHVLFVLGVQRWVYTFRSTEEAFCAALLALILPSFYLGLHTFGQVPFLFSVTLCLHAVAETKRYLDGGNGILRALCTIVAAVCSHHITAVMLLVPLVLFLVWHLHVEEKMSRILRSRLLKLSSISLALSLLALWALLLWVKTEAVVQVEIPHPSRDNFFDSSHAREVLLWPMYGIFLVLFPIGYYWAVQVRHALPLALFSLFLLLMSLGGTTPLPALFFGAQSRWMTYDRFQIFATLLLLPLLSPNLVALWHTLYREPTSRLKRFGVGAFFSLLIVISIPGIFYAASISLLRKSQPQEIDLQPLANFLTSAGHSQWRYLTFGFGERLSKLSYLSNAATIDGQYYTARTLPELTESGIGLIDWSFEHPAIDIFLARPERYHLRWLFFAPDKAEQYAEQLAGHWRRIARLSNSVLVMEPLKTIPELPTARPAPKGLDLPALTWGIIPIFCFSIVLMGWAREFCRIVQAAGTQFARGQLLVVAQNTEVTNSTRALPARSRFSKRALVTAFPLLIATLLGLNLGLSIVRIAQERAKNDRPGIMNIPSLIQREVFCK